MEKKRIEVDYYNEIARSVTGFFEANLSNPQAYRVSTLMGEVSSALRTLMVNGYNAGKALEEYGKNVHRLHLDISLVIENLENGKFEIIIIEIKRTAKLGLNELSQLIGYCLVSEAKFGLLINVDNSVSREFSVILDADKNLTKIVRLIDNKEITHKIGVMVWNSNTLKMEYTESGSIKTMSELVEMIEDQLR